jgi:hypothetical protein
MTKVLEITVDNHIGCLSSPSSLIPILETLKKLTTQSNNLDRPRSPVDPPARVPDNHLDLVKVVLHSIRRMVLDRKAPAKTSQSIHLGMLMERMV